MPERARDEKPGSPAEASPGTEPQSEARSTEPGAAESQPTETRPHEAQADAAGAGRGEAGAPEAVPLAALTTSDLVHSFLSLLALKAWEGMGLVPNALTGKTQKNLDEARLAIDAYAAVFEIFRSRVEEGPRRDMENLLTTLRVNFVDKSAG